MTITHDHEQPKRSSSTYMVVATWLNTKCLNVGIPSYQRSSDVKDRNILVPNLVKDKVT